MIQTVLIVDDHPAMIEGYKSILKSDDRHKCDILIAYDCESAYKIVKNNLQHIDIVLLDVIMPPSEQLKILSGLDLAVLVRGERPRTKLMMLTSHVEAFILYSIIQTVRPEGLLVKSDFTSKEFITAFNAIIQGDDIYYSGTVIQGINDFLKHEIYLDTYNRQIISLLAQGIKTKNLPLHLNLSISAIDKRKAQIKDYFDIQKGTDEDIIRAAKKCGYI